MTFPHLSILALGPSLCVRGGKLFVCFPHLAAPPYQYTQTRREMILPLIWILAERKPCYIFVWPLKGQDIILMVDLLSHNEAHNKNV